mmetsp:Transcript_29030/g.56774  ORF Transcript_29030/g.56774 Transcript_29030/m.56774 type:complete len:108 (+) Transcript_29030:1468-1791(+)
MTIRFLLLQETLQTSAVDDSFRSTRGKATWCPLQNGWESRMVSSTQFFQTCQTSTLPSLSKISSDQGTLSQQQIHTSPKEYCLTKEAGRQCGKGAGTQDSVEARSRD